MQVKVLCSLPVKQAEARLRRTRTSFFHLSTPLIPMIFSTVAIENQTIKRMLFTLERRPDALRGVFQPLNRHEFTLNA
jgi:hypothetical protein